jgi:hypothetical protein
VKKTRKYFSKPAQKNPKKKFAENSIWIAHHAHFPTFFVEGEVISTLRTKKLQNSLRKFRPFFAILRFSLFGGPFWGVPEIDKKLYFTIFYKLYFIFHKKITKIKKNFIFKQNSKKIEKLYFFKKNDKNAKMKI